MVGFDAAPLVLAEYPLSGFVSPDLAIGAIGTDSVFACPARTVDQTLSTQVATFAYEFNDNNAPELFLPPVSFPYGATHASELRYLFKLKWPGHLDAGQKELSDNMIRYWTQFAKVGNPNSAGAPFWPLYNSAQDGFQSLVPPLPVIELEFATDHRCDFWAGLFGAGVHRAVARFTVDAAGNISGSQTRSLNGDMTDETFTGTQKVNSDCAGESERPGFRKWGTGADYHFACRIRR